MSVGEYQSDALQGTSLGVPGDTTRIYPAVLNQRVASMTADPRSTMVLSNTNGDTPNTANMQALLRQVSDGAHGDPRLSVETRAAAPRVAPFILI